MKKNTIFLILLFAFAFANGQDTIMLHLPTPCTSTSIHEPEANPELSFSVYPNPSDGRMAVQVIGNESLGMINVTVISLQGAMVYQNQWYASGNKLYTTLDLSNLASGNYVVTLTNRRRVVSQKVILQKH